MLNPSTADAAVDDPTVKACMWWAEALGCANLEIVNLFSFRSPSPTDIPLTLSEACGPEWERWVDECIRYASKIVCAWGNHGEKHGQNEVIMRKLEGKNPLCLDHNANGAPKHPLYVRRDVSMVRPLVSK